MPRLFQIAKILLFVILLFIIGTFASFFAGEPTNDWIWRLNKFNLAREANLATYFQAILFFLCALSFAIGAKKNGWTYCSWWVRIEYPLLTGICLFFVADELFQIHEMLGVSLEKYTGLLASTPIKERGFSWVILYVPLGILFGLIFLAGIQRYNRHEHLFTRIPVAKKVLILAVICILLVPVCEVIECLFWASGQTRTIFPCIEETAEVLALWSIFTFNLFIIGEPS